LHSSAIVLSSRNGGQGDLRLERGVWVRRVRRADFLTIETPSRQPSFGPASCPEFPLIALFRFAAPLLTVPPTKIPKQSLNRSSHSAERFGVND
jgi:hypothetical protein